MPRHRLTRRKLLKGVLGGAAVQVALPALEIMLNTHGTALADGSALPRRLGIFFWGNGVKLDRWNPSGTGANWPLSPALRPLESVKDYVSVISGMRIRTGNERGHHPGGSVHQTCQAAPLIGR
jgi:hypothetical protein